VAATKVGSRLRCERCGTEIIVVKAAEDLVTCCGQPMLERQA
jgi:hypothetical protein